MEALQLDLLVHIIELACPNSSSRDKDLARIRLVSKACRDAVASSRIRVRPSSMITSEQLLLLCTTFRIECLDLYIGKNLDNSSLEALPSLSHSLKRLVLFGCEWLTSAGAVHLTSLVQLQTLDLQASFSLEAIPDGVGSLTALENLDLGGCRSLAGLPNSLSGLTALSSLSLADCRAFLALPDWLSLLTGLRSLSVARCPSLPSLPETIRHLTLLTYIQLIKCSALATLPAGIRALTLFTALSLAGCVTLASVPEALCDLSRLRDLCLADCRSLAALPEALGRLSGLERLTLRGCVALGGLPEGIGLLSGLTAGHGGVRGDRGAAGGGRGASFAAAMGLAGMRRLGDSSRGGLCDESLGERGREQVHSARGSALQHLLLERPGHTGPLHLPLFGYLL